MKCAHERGLFYDFYKEKNVKPVWFCLRCGHVGEKPCSCGNSEKGLRCKICGQVIPKISSFDWDFQKALQYLPLFDGTKWVDGSCHPWPAIFLRASGALIPPVVFRVKGKQVIVECMDPKWAGRLIGKKGKTARALREVLARAGYKLKIIVPK